MVVGPSLLTILISTHGGNFNEKKTIPAPTPLLIPMPIPRLFPVPIPRPFPRTFSMPIPMSMLLLLPTPIGVTVRSSMITSYVGIGPASEAALAKVIYGVHEASGSASASPPGAAQNLCLRKFVAVYGSAP